MKFKLLWNEGEFIKGVSFSLYEISLKWGGEREGRESFAEKVMMLRVVEEGKVV